MKNLEPVDPQVIAMRVLWALIERAGGSVTIKRNEATDVTGQMHVSWNDGDLTVSIGENAPGKKQ